MRKYLFLLSLFGAITTLLSAQNITRLEYSIDGFVAEGKGTALEIPENLTELDDAFNIDISELEPGNHTIHVRAMNDEGVWSFAAERSFYIPEPPITDGIVAMEYSFDEMVKEGDGEMIALQDGTNELDSTLLFDISGLEPGIHNIYMRSRNKLGKWSLPAKQTFVISEPDTARIEYVHYRIFNDGYEGDWMVAPIDPARKNIDSTLMVSAAGLNFDENYSIEFYAENTSDVRGFSAYLNGFSLRMNNPPQRTKDTLELKVSAQEELKLDMDSLFNDDDLTIGDRLDYAITETDNPGLMLFRDWETESLLAFSPTRDNQGEYQFRLVTTDLSGDSDSIEVILTVTSATSVQDKRTASSSFLLYPNPAKDYVIVKANSIAFSKYRLSLFNSTGKLVTSTVVEKDEYRMSLNNIPDGMYFFVFRMNDLIERRKLVVQ